LRRPLILSRIPVHEEQAPPASRFFEPDDVDGLSTIMTDLLDTPLAAASTAEASSIEFVGDCVARLSDIALQTRASYVPEKHNPAALLVELLHNLADRPDNAAWNQLRQRSILQAKRLLADQRNWITFVRAAELRYPESAPALVRELSGSTRASADVIDLQRRLRSISSRLGAKIRAVWHAWTRLKR
jgi:hypothetical protein